MQTKKKKIIIVVAVVFAAICILYGVLMLNADKIDKVMSNLETQTTSDVINTENTVSTETTAENQTTIKKDYSYDDLQKIFLEITPETTLDDFLKMIDKYDVEQMHQNYRNMDGNNETVYKIAYESKVAWLSHADTGDYVQVGFNENQELRYAEYFNTNAWLYDKTLVYSAILENDNTSTIGEIGYFGKYSKTATESGYNKFTSGKSVINDIIDNSEKFIQEIDEH